MVQAGVSGVDAQSLSERHVTHDAFVSSHSGLSLGHASPQALAWNCPPVADAPAPASVPAVPAKPATAEAVFPCPEVPPALPTSLDSAVQVAVNSQSWRLFEQLATIRIKMTATVNCLVR